MGSRYYNNPGEGLVSGSGTDNHVVRWDGATHLQDSGVIVDDSDNMSGVNILTAAEIHVYDVITTGDNIIVLNDDVAGAPSEDAGIEIERGTSTNSQFIWNETTGNWDCGIAGNLYQILTTYNITTAEADTLTNGLNADLLHTHNYAGTYLKLDCSNDPLTDDLEIQGAISVNASTYGESDSVTFHGNVAGATIRLAANDQIFQGLANNTYYDGADWKNDDTGEGSSLFNFSPNGGLDFFTRAPAATEGLGKLRLHLANDGDVSLGGDMISGDYSNAIVTVRGDNVGVGTTAPIGRLHVYQSGSDTDLVVERDSSNNASLVFRKPGTETGQISTNSNDDIIVDNFTKDKDIILKVRDDIVLKTITWDADVDMLKHSAGEFNFHDDNIATTGIVSGINITSGDNPGHTHTALAIKEEANRSIYVDHDTGSDSNDGTSWGEAFQTIQKGIDDIKSIIASGVTITIYARGIFTEDNADDFSGTIKKNCEGTAAVVLRSDDYVYNTAASGGSNNTITFSGTYDDDYWNDCYIVLNRYTGRGQLRKITDSSSSAGTTTITVDSNWSTNPDATTIFSIAGRCRITKTGAEKGAIYIKGGSTNARVYGIAWYDFTGDTPSGLLVRYGGEGAAYGCIGYSNTGDDGQGDFIAESYGFLTIQRCGSYKQTLGGVGKYFGRLSPALCAFDGGTGPGNKGLYGIWSLGSIVVGVQNVFTNYNSSIYGVRNSFIQLNSVFGADGTSYGIRVDTGTTLWTYNTIDLSKSWEQDYTETNLLINRTSASVQPTPDTGEIRVWRDPDDNKTYIIYNDTDEGVRKVEMT